MTPTALHALVAGPYTMPDGSLRNFREMGAEALGTRRGLWERVPDTKPVDAELWGAPMQRPDAGEYVTMTGAAMALSCHAAAESARERGLAALIRVAIEDWLHSLAWTVTIQRQLKTTDWQIRPDTPYIAIVLIPRIHPIPSLELSAMGTSALSALVTVGHMVADALNVPA